MVTAHPVPHPQREPRRGVTPGLRAGGPRMRIVSGRLNHQNSER
jgi:hypothetical protein